MKLLVATDGSKNSLRAVSYAADLLGKLNEGGSMTLISVHDDAALRHARRFVSKQAIDDYLNELSEHDLAEAKSMLDQAGVKYDVSVRTGHIASEIAQAGEAGSYDLIVLGSKGRSALKDLLIGAEGTLPWHLPEDARLFRVLTWGATVVMGRLTWESLPERFRPLPGRDNVVLTRRTDWSPAGARVVRSRAEALRSYEGNLWVIGGSSVYAEFLPEADLVVRTDVDLAVTGDTYAPAVPENWRKVFRSPEAGWATSSNGRIAVGVAHAGVDARSARGDIRIGEVARGRISLQSGAGDLEIGIRESTAAWLQVHTRFGSVRNSLGPAEGPRPGEEAAEVHAQTGVGDIVVRRSTAAPTARQA